MINTKKLRFRNTLMETYQDAIFAWHKKSNYWYDYFTRFILEYLAFISFINTQLYLGNESDRQKIQRFKRNSIIRNQYFDNLRSDDKLRYYWDKIIDELHRAPLGNVSRDARYVEEIEYFNCSHIDKNQKTASDLAKPTGQVHSTTDWENMVEFWYSIRNNLFHGMKNPELQRDKLLISNGFKTLRPLVDILIQNINNIDRIT